MRPLFLYGTLRHRPLLDLVLGHHRAETAIPARMPGAQAFWVKGQSFPMIAHAPGQVAIGIVLPEMTPEDQARLDYYEGGHDYRTVEMAVQTYAGTMEANVYWPGEGWQAGDRWDLKDWESRFGAATMIAAKEVMGRFGHQSAEVMARRLPSIRARAASWLRAQAEVPRTTLRRKSVKADVEVLDVSQAYTGFFALEDVRLRHRRFDGTMSDPMDRAMFISTDSAVVLPYDPKTDRVVLIEQFRPVPLMRGDPQPWILEAVAGRIDPGESPQDAARREVREEAGLELESLIEVSRNYPSAGAVVEYLYAFIGLADLSDVSEQVGGLETEGEDIRRHVISFDQLMALIDTGEIRNGPLELTALNLLRLRPTLRKEAGL